MRNSSLVLLIAVFAVLLLAASGCSCARGAPGVEPDVTPDGTPEPTPVEADAETQDAGGIRRFHKVADGLYRGEQPEEEGFKALADIGIETLINLRSSASDIEHFGAKGFQEIRIPLHPWGIKEDDVVRFLKAVTNPENRPAFVHCALGRDRTGVMIAAYRVVVERWTKEKAVEEMLDIGDDDVWRGLEELVMALDIEAIRAKAGLKD